MPFLLLLHISHFLPLAQYNGYQRSSSYHPHCSGASFVVSIDTTPRNHDTPAHRVDVVNSPAPLAYSDPLVDVLRDVAVD